MDAQRHIRGFANAVELAMQRQNQHGIFGDAEIIGGDGDALLLEIGDLVEQRMRIENDAIADHRQLAGPHHARGQQR
jgi:hypothetical protein